MVKIVVCNQMFVKDKYVTITFPDGKTDVYANIAPAVVLGLAKKYGADKIYVNGNKMYNQKYVRELNEAKKLAYEDLDVEIINGIKERK